MLRRTFVPLPAACLLVVGLLAWFFAAPTPSVRADEKDDDRPNPMRVFRSVLDERARMITIPIHDDLWLAYDATYGGLYKAWVGDVKFDGAVYTTVHGPQPTARGATYIHDEWDRPWHIRMGPAEYVATAQYRGYRIQDGAVTIHWDVVKDDTTVSVRETPRLERTADGNPVLVRTFVVAGSDKDKPLVIHGQVDGCVKGEDVASNAKLTTLFASTPPRREHGLTQIQYRATLPQGKTTELRYTFDKEKVLAWGKAEAAKAAAAKKEEAKKDEEEKPVVLEHPKDTPLGNGVSVRIYQIGESMAQLRKLVPGQTPNWSHVIPVLDLRTERGDFGEATDEFITHVDGFLEIPADGTYEFQLISDDGSRLFINDKVVVDHDGLHGSTEMEGKVELTKGRHKLFVEHFENGGGEQLTLNWRPPGAEAFALVPNESLRAPKGEVRVTSPGNKKIEKIVPRYAPGDGGPLDGVHPAYDLMTVRPDDFEPRVGGMDWLPDGRLVICCWEPRGGVYALDGVEGDDREKITVTRIADGLAEPLGLKVVDGRIFVLQKQELTELVDNDKDGLIDEYRCVAAGWGVTANFHEFAFGLVHKDGHFYAALATAIDPGGASTQPQNPDRGKVVKIAMDGSFEYVAEGLRTPNGIGLGIDDEIFITDNQGDWVPVSKVVHLSKGAFFGGRSVDFEGTADKTEKPPVVWLPQGEIGNSPGEPGVIKDGPYKGQMLHAEVTHGGLKRVYVEKIDGQYQGCVFRFTQGLEAGLNRFTHGPDGAIYVGGIGSAGNWGQTGKLKHGLQRIKYNGASVFEMLRVRPLDGWLEIEFTEPLADPSGVDPQDYVIQQWRYEPTKNYGGPKIGVETLEVTAASRSDDRRRVTLRVPGLREGRVVYVRLARTVRGEGGKAPWSTEAWYTLNKFWRDESGREDHGVAEPPPPPPANVLTPAQTKAGWRLLFDGKSCENFRGFKRDDLPGAWSAKDGTLAFDPKHEDRGDIITKAEYESYVLELEWRVAERGNSGIMFHVGEGEGAPWATGPEMQILDNEGHPDGRSKLTSAGASYALVAPVFDVTRPPGRWNRARLVVDGTRIEHWLNGWKLLEYELGSDAWKELVAKSKFKDMKAYGSLRKGHISLQDHGDVVAFRNIRILPLER